MANAQAIAQRLKQVLSELQARQKVLDYRTALSSIVDDDRWAKVAEQMSKIEADKVQLLTTGEMTPHRLGHLQGQIDILRTITRATLMGSDDVAQLASRVAELRTEANALQDRLNAAEMDPVDQFTNSLQGD
jgi:hypothetical protein